MALEENLTRMHRFDPASGSYVNDTMKELAADIDEAVNSLNGLALRAARAGEELMMVPLLSASIAVQTAGKEAERLLGGKR